ncbi:MAG TPA: monovalent cation:proton antiporter-2 (CPA2) family protein [Nordella sp.]|nr:monovalent cation:proton antiporter-2 (CPA2) family protein [Nordella sp.]
MQLSLDSFLLGAFIYLSAAVISVPIATRLGLGSVLGYLIAGMLVGPAVLGLVGSEGEDVMHFAEFGVIVMLFLVGLELQPSKLWTLRKPILGLGGLQVVGTAAVLAIALILYGLAWKTSLTIGLILAMSSTAIVLQSLAERRQLKTSGGQAVFSVLLFQDIAVIPILALLPLLAISGEALPHGEAGYLTTLPAWQQALTVFAAVGLIVLAGRFLMRPLFRLIAMTGLREIFVALALALVVGITLLMETVGLSPALGTFLAGVLLAESEYRHELEMDLEPFKGLLLAVFFIAVGAGINFKLVAAEPGLIFGGVLAFVLIKLIVLYAIARLARMKPPRASLFSFSLAQGGEFAFVLISFAAGLGLLAATQASMLIAVVALSMAAAPLLMMLDAKAIQPRFVRYGFTRDADRIEATGSPAIILGHGRFGMTVGRVLAANGARATVLDHDAEQIDALRRFGFKVFYGDASREDLLESAGAKDARILVVAIDDRDKTLEIVETARRRFPHLEIFARAFDRTHAYALLNAGVTHVYREVFDSSLAMAEDALVALGTHPYEATRALNLFRKHDEALIRRAARHSEDIDTIIDISRAAQIEIERVLSGDQRPRAEWTPDRSWDTPTDAARDPRSISENEEKAAS